MSDNEHSSAAADYVESEATDPRYGWSETAHEEISANKLNDRSSLHDGHVQPQGSSKISSSDNDAGKTQPIVNLGVHMRCNGNPWYSLTWDMLSILISICFIILGACVFSLEGKTQSAWSNKIIHATLIAPSLWPVLFSGVLGNAVRSLADWRVERGASLIDLEQLMGSLTVTTRNLTASLDNLGGAVPSAAMLINTTSILTFPIEPVYALILPWIILCFISVAVMFAAAIFSLVMHHRCHAPQILGFVSSLTRNSRYFEGKQGNSSEDGAKTAKRLRSLRVRVEDVHAGADVGKIAFAPAQGGLRVRGGRWYE